MDGWARRYLVITPDGIALPCHQAAGIAALAFESVRGRSLADLWERSPAFQAFRGEAWMPEPCRSCDERGRDFGGCRCQALALTGDAAATDPACALSPHHAIVRRARARADAAAEAEAETGAAPAAAVVPIRLRRFRSHA
jgi:pyrroloquinoline quinone biosynthesis protein E